MQSKALPFSRKLLGSRDFQAFSSEGFSYAREEVRHLDRNNGLRGQEARYNTLALGYLNLMAIAQEVFDYREAVAEVADRGFFHVIHFSITTSDSAKQIVAMVFRNNGALAACLVRLM
jgi:hypothetical protein